MAASATCKPDSAAARDRRERPSQCVPRTRSTASTAVAVDDRSALVGRMHHAVPRQDFAFMAARVLAGIECITGGHRDSMTCADRKMAFAELRGHARNRSMRALGLSISAVMVRRSFAINFLSSRSSAWPEPGPRAVPSQRRVGGVAARKVAGFATGASCHERDAAEAPSKLSPTLSGRGGTAQATTLWGTKGIRVRGAPTVHPAEKGVYSPGLLQRCHSGLVLSTRLN